MAGLLDDLITLLREQVNDFLDLAALATEKREAIIKNDVEHLQTIVNIENSIVGRNQKADRRRIELMKDVATVLNSDSNTLTISHLANLLEGKPGQDELIEVGEALREAADELKKINEQNRSLIENSLEYIDFSMNLMRSSQTQAYYTPEGEEMPGASSAFFDAKQ